MVVQTVCDIIFMPFFHPTLSTSAQPMFARDSYNNSKPKKMKKKTGNDRTENVKNLMHHVYDPDDGFEASGSWVGYLPLPFFFLFILLFYSNILFVAEAQ